MNKFERFDLPAIDDADSGQPVLLARASRLPLRVVVRVASNGVAAFVGMRATDLRATVEMGGADSLPITVGLASASVYEIPSGGRDYYDLEPGEELWAVGETANGRVSVSQCNLFCGCAAANVDAT